MSSRRLVLLSALLLGVLPRNASSDTIITNSRAEVSFMASLWESDTIQISPLVNAQYPNCSGTWQYIYPVTVEADGDVHIRTGITSSTSTSCYRGNNLGNSPLIDEIVNVFSTSNPNWATLPGSGSQAKPTGIFRFYTEHTSNGDSSGVGERHFEIHPMTALYVWNTASNAFVFRSDYHGTITNVSDGTTHAASTLRGLFDGSRVTTAIVTSADSSRVIFTYPSPSVNYVQYGGLLLSPLTNDSVSSYFWFQSINPSITPQVAIRCRVITNTIAAAIASVLTSNQSVSVNALTRVDMLVISNQIAAMTAGQTNVFTSPVELITLGLITGTPSVSSVNPNCGIPSGGTPITITGNNFFPGSTVTIGGVPATNVVYSNINTLTAVTPTNTAGAKNVVVRTPSASSPGTLMNGFTYAYIGPGTFGGLSSATPGVEGATLNWSSATGTGVTYNVFKATASGAENFGSPVASTTNLSAFVQPLLLPCPLTNLYYFVVRAADGCGNSESNTVEKSMQPLLDPNKSQLGDGISNGWKLQYGFNVCDTNVDSADPDGDGATNLQEYLAGTDPTNAASAFRITLITRQGNNVRVTWMTAGGRTNVVQGGLGDFERSSISYSNLFFDISPPFVIPGSGGVITNFLDDGSVWGDFSNWPSRYYRVRLAP
jgi:hypothetical protein